MRLSRIPEFTNNTFDGMLGWFAEMSVRGLLFHPDDSPEDIISVDDGSPVFSNRECEDLNAILGVMFSVHGSQVHEACYPVFVRKSGLRLDA